MKYVWPAVGFLFLIHMLEGSNVVTALAFAGFTVVMVDAFNTVGGLIYPSGAYIFFAGLLTLILGGVSKAVLGEALDSNLFNAQKTMLVYLAGSCAIWTAAKISVLFRAKRPLLRKLQISKNLQQTAVGGLLIGFWGPYLLPVAYRSTFNQANAFIALSLMIMVYANTKESDGHRSSSVFAICLWCGLTILGLLAFSKQGIFSPSMSWAIGATVGGYRLTMRRAVGAVSIFLLMSVFLAPISQVGRGYRGTGKEAAVAMDLLTHPLRTREQYNQTQKVLETMKGFHWFNHGEGLMDRLTMFPIDDALIRRSDQGHTMGPLPLISDAINMIPRYLVKDKQALHWGNHYAHEIGMLSQKDGTTGISFSAFAEGYHCLLWWGVTAVSMPLYLMLFVVSDSLTGSTRDTFWATLYIVFCSHYAPEGMLNTTFYGSSFMVVTITFVAFTSRYILPVIGGLVLPTPRLQGPPLSARVVRPVRKPLLPVPPRTIEEKL